MNGKTMSRTEQVVMALFSEALGSSEFGVDDSFIELGGNSIQVLRLISRIRATMNIDLPVSTLFAAPTVATLSKKLDQLASPELGSKSSA
jgi:aryl carrier-like protein